MPQRPHIVRCPSPPGPLSLGRGGAGRASDAFGPNDALLSRGCIKKRTGDGKRCAVGNEGEGGGEGDGEVGAAVVAEHRGGLAMAVGAREPAVLDGEREV